MPKGSVRKRDNTWYYRFYENGKLIERSGGKTKNEALKKLNEELNRQYKGFSRPDEMLFSDYLNMWLENYIKYDKSPNTYYKYQTSISARIIPYLGHIKLCDMKVMHIENFLRELRNDSLNSTSVQEYYGVVNSALNRAVKLQMIITNPCKYIDPPKRNNYKANILELEEINLICTKLDPSIYGDYIFKLGLDLTIETGLRRGEMCGLTWEDIDIPNKCLHVNQSLIRIGKDYTISKPKTQGSYRTIPISDSLLKKLESHKIRQKENKLLYGEFYINPSFNGRSYDLLFRKENGDFIIPSRFLQRLKRLCKSNNIEKNIRWHDLRHTNATLLLQSGVNMKVVQDRLGHSLMQTTADTYSHVTKKMNREATDKLTNLLNF